MSRPTIAIVGGGFSGTLLALHLLAGLRRSANIRLIERGPAFGRGLAYSTRLPEHLLNVRAGNMSAYPDQPTHFQDWLAVNTGQASDPFSFAPRWVYGDYLQGELRAAAQGAEAAGRLDLVQDQVVAIRRVNGRLRVELALGRVLEADIVALATGHGAASAPVGADARFARDPAYVGDPWAAGALDGVGRDDSVLLLGAGLTAVDVIASLDGQGHRASILALSRRGLLPHRHARFRGDPAPWTPRPGEPLSRALRRFRRDAERLSDWRRAFDGLRGVTQSLWQGLDDTQRRRFLRHLRPWWDIHRHRMAPRIADRIAAHLEDGRLRVVAGRLKALHWEVGAVTATWRPRGQTTLVADRARWVINCAGSEGDPIRSGNPLVRDLIARGMARADPLKLGLEADADGHLMDAGGATQRDLFGIGPIIRGGLWEVVAAPDLRLEAQRLAGRITASLQHRLPLAG
jgi:uncharacterized NAD(P)/FAD-binding protein YdhS